MAEILIILLDGDNSSVKPGGENKPESFEELKENIPDLEKNSLKLECCI